MVLYKVIVKATSHGFLVDAQEILSVYLWDSCCKNLRKSDIDRILANRLYAYEPELEVYTYDRERVETYITEMKEMIRLTLKERLSYTDYLLDVCR